MPLFVQWKGQLPAGKVYEQPVISLDILPTAIAAAGSKPGTDWQLDGVNLLPYFKGENAAAPHDHLCWRFGTQWAIRQGDWKLVAGFDYDANPHAAAAAEPAQGHRAAALQPGRPTRAKRRTWPPPSRTRSPRCKRLYDKWNAANQPPAWVPNPNPGKAKKAK